MIENRPYIVISNDDGINAPGIHLLADIAAKFGDVLVMAPEREHSGQSHAVTVKTPLQAHFIEKKGNITYYSCSGTPVDSVKLAIKTFAERKPDLVLAGINHGTNVGVNVFYSGTVAVAIEAVFEGIPSIAFSIDNHSRKEDISAMLPYVEKMIRVALENTMPANCCWNVNAPFNPEGGLKGIKVCSMSQGSWHDFYEKRINPMGEPYYWIFGDYSDDSTSEITDFAAIQNGYVALVPISIDVTNYTERIKLSSLF
ncbi:MAG: 5'/3'-nucleotidase SurE [Bacteroidales bacterium]|nr:5'/3'-nucleotidase SurE [Bacteroidales bacterium]